MRHHKHSVFAVSLWHSDGSARSRGHWTALVSVFLFKVLKFDISLADKEPHESFSIHGRDIVLGFLLLHMAYFGAQRISLCWFRQSYSVRLAQNVIVQCALTFSGDLTHMAIVGLPHLTPPQILCSGWHVLCFPFITYPAPLYNVLHDIACMTPVRLLLWKSSFPQKAIY